MPGGIVNMNRIRLKADCRPVAFGAIIFNYMLSLLWFDTFAAGLDVAVFYR